MDQVCAELEKESESDSQDVKKRRFDTILELMQKVSFVSVVCSKLTFLGLCFVELGKVSLMLILVGKK
jgi:hypothetical protein